MATAARAVMGDWIILRTAGRHTMRLADALTTGGYEAWTPVETKVFHVPRMNSKRSVRLPIMPSYVFARAHNLVDLLGLTESMAPGFSVMRCNDRIPVIADRHLQGLRTLEAKRTPRSKAQPFARGLSVRVKTEGGSFAGMSGRVERSDQGDTLVCFDNRLTVKISTSLLCADEIGVVGPCFGMAA